MWKGYKLYIIMHNIILYLCDRMTGMKRLATNQKSNTKIKTHALSF